jgi:hypothetical protein
MCWVAWRQRRRLRQLDRRDLSALKTLRVPIRICAALLPHFGHLISMLPCALPETQSTEHGGSNRAEAKYVKQGFPEFRHVRQPPFGGPLAPSGGRRVAGSSGKWRAGACTTIKNQSPIILFLRMYRPRCSRSWR